MKMISTLRLTLVSVCLLTVFGCTKDELTKPAAVRLQMEMAGKEVNMRKQVAGPFVKIEKARYRLSQLEFEGYRQNARNYFFTKEFENGFELTVEEGKPAAILDFDMPQGAYERIKISYKVAKVEAKGSPGKVGSGSDGMENSIIMEGYYMDVRQQKVPLLFIYNYDETFEQVALADQQGIVIEKDRNSLASIEFDAAYWLQLINGRMLQSAKLTQVNGRQTIVLSEDENEHIFNLLTSRIRDASELSFQ